MAEEGVGFAHFPHVPHVPDVEGVVVVDDADPSVLLVVADGHRVGVLSLLQGKESIPMCQGCGSGWI